MSATTHLDRPTFASVLALVLLAAPIHADSVNWRNTVGEPIAALQQDRFEYDLDLRPVLELDARVAAKRRDDCLECAPTGALRLDADERLDQRLRHTYRKLGEDLAARLWDDPKGRRVRFDVAGRPGIGLQIPLD